MSPEAQRHGRGADLAAKVTSGPTDLEIGTRALDAVNADLSVTEAPDRVAMRGRTWALTVEQFKRKPFV